MVRVELGGKPVTGLKPEALLEQSLVSKVTRDVDVEASDKR